MGNVCQQAPKVEGEIAIDGAVLNSAFCFIKPHAMTDQVKELVEKQLKARGIKILSEGSISAEKIDSEGLIDTHYGAIASRALKIKPAKLVVQEKAKEDFEKLFKMKWDDALKKGVVFNAADGAKKMGITAMEMSKEFEKLKRGEDQVKFGGGFYVGKVGEIFVINGFYEQLRSKFTAPGTSIHWFEVQWEPAKLPWQKFRAEVVGATNPTEAAEGSIRSMIYKDWQALGLSAEPNTGDNGIHASASAFEGLAEKVNWLKAEVEGDAFGKAIVDIGITEEIIKYGFGDPAVTYEGTKQSLFDCLEDNDAKDCIEKLRVVVSDPHNLPTKANAGKYARTMSPAALNLLLARPKVPAPLDANFSPLILGKNKYLEAAKGCEDKLEWALPRADGCARYWLHVFPDDDENVEASIYLAGVLIQEMIWQRSASSLLLAGPETICQAMKEAFSEGGAYEFEAKSMPNVCGTPDTPFEVRIVTHAELPEAKDTPQVCGTDASGSRLAFDLGKSDIKTVAVKDNEVLYSKETEWDVTNPDPQYHFDAIVAALKLAKEKLEKVDAMGGSATGTISANNEATWCDIFPNVPPDVYKAQVVDIFQRICKEVAGDVPLKVINDGEVTALAAFKKIKAGNILGISMGSSEGAGYANKDGNLMGWINELCYVKLDLNPDAPRDPWTKGAHQGISHMYLGQRGATKLASKAGVKDLPDNYKYPNPNMQTIRHEDHAQCLKLIQKSMADPETEAQVARLYETVGVYLGYAVAQYCEFYPIDHVMILGRVSKGKGGDIMLETAKKVLATEFPKHKNIKFHTADEEFKAVGQCIAAAALPSLA